MVILTNRWGTELNKPIYPNNVVRRVSRINFCDLETDFRAKMTKWGSNWAQVFVAVWFIGDAHFFAWG
jgi:hypothetical protein